MTTNVIQYDTGMDLMYMDRAQINFSELTDIKEHDGIFTLGYTYTRYRIENVPIIDHVNIGTENTYVIWNDIKYETKEDFHKLYLEIEKRNMEKMLDSLP